LISANLDRDTLRNISPGLGVSTETRARLFPGVAEGKPALRRL
jgi:hypothetical protein